MGYYFVMGECFNCRRPFSFNPNYVPAIRDSNNEKQPICGDCIAAANIKRKARGSPPFVVHPKAYEPQNEFEC